MDSSLLKAFPIRVLRSECPVANNSMSMFPMSECSMAACIWAAPTRSLLVKHWCALRLGNKE